MSWKMQLVKSMNNVDLVLMKTNQLTVIKDKFPKAEKHFLVLPNEEINGINDLGREHLELLKKMMVSAREAVREFGSGRQFRYGFHAQPSMQRLHMHIISEDFNSNALKTAKHWNSFTTRFFLSFDKVVSDLESVGKVLIPSKMECCLLLKTTLKCHKCDMKLKNMPTLKSHLITHVEKC